MSQIYLVPILDFGGDGEASAPTQDLFQELLVSQSVGLDGIVLDEKPTNGSVRPLQPGRAYEYDGTTIQATADVPVGTYPLTIWVRFASTSVAAIDAIVALASATSAADYLTVTVNTGALTLSRNGTTTPIGNGYGAGTFHDVVIRFNDATSFDVFLDGVKTAYTGQTNVTLAGDLSKFLLGRRSFVTPSNYFEGKIAGSGYWNSSLTDAQCESISANIVPASSDAFFKCDETNTLIGFDSSGNNRNLLFVDRSFTFNYEGNDVPYSWENSVGYTRGVSLETAGSITSSYAVPATSNFEVEILAAIADVSAISALFDSRPIAGTNTSIYAFVTATGQITLRVNATDITTPLTYDDGEWRTYKFIHSGTDISISVDDETVISTPFVGSTTVSPDYATIGQVTGGGTYVPAVIALVKLTVDSTIRIDYRFDQSTTGIYNHATSTTDGSLQGTSIRTNVARNESSTPFDVAGKVLQFSGIAPVNGQIINSPCPTFDGIEEYIVASNFTEIDMSSPWEIEMRMRLPSNTGIRCLMGMTSHTTFTIRHNAAPTNWDITLNGFTDGVDAWRAINLQSVGFSYNTWHTLRVTWDGVDEMELLLDDNSVGTKTITTPAASFSGFQIGRRNLAAGEFWDGNIFDFKFTQNGNLNVHYPMSEYMGNVITDVSGNNRHAAIMGAVTDPAGIGFWAGRQDLMHWSIAKGYDRVASLNGTTDSIDLGDPDSMEITATNSYSIVWRAATNDTGGSLVGKGAGGGNQRIHFYVNPADNKLHRWNDSLISLTSVNDGRWRHYVYTYESGGTNTGVERLYLDGLLESSRTGAMPIPEAGDWRIGSKTGFLLNCSVAEFRFYDKVLTQDEVNYLNLDGASGVNPGLDNLKAHLPLDESVGTMARDISLYRNHGTVLGGNDIWEAEIPTNINQESPARRGAATSPAGAYHNGGMSQLNMATVAAPCSQNLETGWSFNTARTNPRFRRTTVQNTFETRADRFVAYKSTLAGAQLEQVEAYVQAIGTTFDYYVAPGGNDANPGTIDSPLASITFALSLGVDVSVGVFGGNTYAGAVSLSGTQRLGSYNGKATLTHTSQATVTILNSAELEDMIVDSTDTIATIATISMGGDGQIRRCDLYPNNNKGLTFSSGDGAQAEECVLEDRDNACAQLVTFHVSSNCVLTKSVIRRVQTGTQIGIYFHGLNSITHTVSECDIVSDAGGGSGIALQVETDAPDQTIRECRIRGDWNLLIEGRNDFIAHNCLLDGRDHLGTGYIDISSGAVGILRSVTIVTTGQVVNQIVAGASSSADVSNSVLYFTNGNRSYYAGAGTFSNVDYNIYNGSGLATPFNGQDFVAWQSGGRDLNSTVADPGFSDAANGEFWPDELGSAMTDQGTPISGFNSRVIHVSAWPLEVQTQNDTLSLEIGCFLSPVNLVT